MPDYFFRMDERTLILLEFERLLDFLAGEAASEPGTVRCLGLRPDLDADEARANWLLVDEALSILNLEGAPPLEGITDISHFLERLEVEGALLRPLELLAVLRVARASRGARKFILAQMAVGLHELAEALPVMRDLESTIERSVGPDGEILDTASSGLARVRSELTGLRGAIQNRLAGLMRTKEVQDVVRDQIVTRRAGRYVIPVRSSSRKQIPALVHDYSASGATAFVEPLEMVEDNNRLNYLRRQEKREVEKVLQRLSVMTAEASAQLASALDLLVRLDVLFAQASLSRRLKARAPLFDPHGGIDLRDARHPLLLARESETDSKTVAIDAKLPPESRVLVISGINAGGKTVAMKTLGLLALMAQTGLHLPVGEGSRFRFFDKILAVIGDEQDINSDLSTFSGHVRRLGWVLREATENTLVLLDELGTGTDPAEGAALALAVLDELKERKVWVLTATHYHLLKAWAHLNDGVANAAVRTDATGRPIFGLDYGSPGFSAGLAMARDLGLDPDLIRRAEGYLNEGQKKTLSLMERLEEERATLAMSRAACEYLEEELAATLANCARAENERFEAHQDHLDSLRARVDRSIAHAEKEFQEIRRQMQDKAGPGGALLGRFHRVKQDLRRTADHREQPAGTLSFVRPGDWVQVRSLGRDGRVTSVNESRGQVEVDLGGMKVRASKDDLAQSAAKPRKRKMKKQYLATTFSSPPLELNLLGFTVDEALPVVEKSLDQAQMGGLKSLTIIHGIGTGRLRQAIRGYLREDFRVKDFHGLEGRAGGEGVTMVELAD